MHRPKLPLDGACRCGRVKIRISAPPLITMACHCTGCQRMSGSAYSLSAAIPTEGFAVVEGAPVVAGASAEAGHHFCPDCMTWMFTRPQGLDFFVNVRPTMLEETSWYSPFIETYTSENSPGRPRLPNTATRNSPPWRISGRCCPPMPSARPDPFDPSAICECPP